MINVVQISSLYYCAVCEGDNIMPISMGYPTYEQCNSMTKMVDKQKII